MKAIRYILPILFIGMQFSLKAQNLLPTKCPGDRIATYTVSGSVGSTFQWDLPENASIVYQSAYGDTIKVDWKPSYPGTYEFSVSELNEHGCLGDPGFGKVTVVANQKVFEADELNFCEGDTLEILPANYTNVEWQDGSTTIPYLASTSGTIAVQVLTDGDCNILDTINVFRHQLPKPDLEPVITICEGNEVILDPGFFTTYEWSNGDIADQLYVEPVANDSIIWVKVSNEWGCYNIDSVLFLACDDEDLFNKIPNVFNPKSGSGRSPSGNSQWVLEVLEDYPNARLEIFDRWGRLVFSTNEAASDFWDGTYKGNDLPADSYYYVIDLGTDSENNRRVSGSVSIIY